MFFCFIWLIIHRFYISRCSKLFYNIKVGSSHICRTLSWSFFLLKCANRAMQAFGAAVLDVHSHSQLFTPHSRMFTTHSFWFRKQA